MAETLTQQKIRERDEAMQAFDRAGSPSRFSRIPTRIGIAAQKQDLAERKLQFEQDRAAQDAAAKADEAARRADEAAARASHFQRMDELRQQQLAVQQQTAAFQEAAAKAHVAQMEAELAKQTAKMESTAEVATAARNIYREVSKLDRNAADFDQKFSAIQAQNAAAIDHPETQKFLKYVTETRSKGVEMRKREEAAKAAGLVVSKLTPEGVTMTKPGVPVDDAQKHLAHLETLRMSPKMVETDPKTGKPTHPDEVAYLDRNILAIKAGKTPEPIPASLPPLPASASAAAPVIPGEIVAPDAAPTTTALKPLDDEAAAAARAAITAGASTDAVRKRLQESGYDHSKL